MSGLVFCGVWIAIITAAVGGLILMREGREWLGCLVIGLVIDAALLLGVVAGSAK